MTARGPFGDKRSNSSLRSVVEAAMIAVHLARSVGFVAAFSFGLGVA